MPETSSGTILIERLIIRYLRMLFEIFKSMEQSVQTVNRMTNDRVYDTL